MPSQKSAIPRDFKNRGTGNKIPSSKGGGLSESLSTNLPKPNILRIEVLDGNARKRYLAAVQRAGDNIRASVYQQTTQPGERVFYGFLVAGSETGFNMSSNWNAETGSGAVLDTIKGLAGAVPGVNTAVGGIAKALEGIGDIGGSLLGINKSTTGSGTVKEFAGVGLSDFHVKCGWYIPEQYQLCIKSLKTVYRMAYPKQTDLSVVDSLINKTTTYIKAKATTKLVQSNTDEPDGVLSQAVDAAGNLIKGAAKGVMQLQEDFGSNYTFNPLPVRVSVGQYMDIEPLVITAVNTSFSKETFINYSGTKDKRGRHLPIMVTTDITFQYWLNPAPDLQFASILGQELFGTEPVPDKSIIKKEGFDSYNSRSNEGAGLDFASTDEFRNAAIANGSPQYTSVADLPSIQTKSATTIT